MLLELLPARIQSVSANPNILYASVFCLPMKNALSLCSPRDLHLYNLLTSIKNDLLVSRMAALFFFNQLLTMNKHCSLVFPVVQFFWLAAASAL